jgi:hypothetical protein
MLLIITNTNDVHANCVGKLLDGLEVPYCRINTDRFLLDSSASVKFSPNLAQYQVNLGSTHIDLADVRCVWLRKPREPILHPLIHTPHKVSFTQTETRAFFDGLWLSLTNCTWINPPLATYTAESKLLQLQKASKLGLMIPRTLVTNDSEEAFRFFDECEDGVIIKALRRGVYERDGGTLGIVRTTRLTAGDRSRLADVKFCPVLLQEYIRKKHELRVTVIGPHVFTCEIHSQADERTSVDWRRYDVDIPYKQGSLPGPVERTLLQLVSQLGLVYGACDLIVTEDGRYCFLEVNPSGQWLWAEKKTGLPISQTLATHLSALAHA